MFCRKELTPTHNLNLAVFKTPEPNTISNREINFFWQQSLEYLAFRFPHVPTNNLCGNLWKKQKKRQIPLGIGDDIDEPVFFTNENGCSIMLPPKWNEQVEKDSFAQMGHIVELASMLAEYEELPITTPFWRLGDNASNLNAKIWHGIYLHHLTRIQPEYKLNSEQQKIMQIVDLG
jgi:hypothetical protein